MVAFVLVALAEGARVGAGGMRPSSAIDSVVRAALLRLDENNEVLSPRAEDEEEEEEEASLVLGPVASVVADVRRGLSIEAIGM